MEEQQIGLSAMIEQARFSESKEIVELASFNYFRGVEEIDNNYFKEQFTLIHQRYFQFFYLNLMHLVVG